VPVPDTLNMLAENTAATLRAEAELLVQRSLDGAGPARWQCCRQLAELFQAYCDGTRPSFD